MLSGQHPRRHKLLPVLEEVAAKENPVPIYSDHLPILVQSPTLDLNLISLNVLDRSSAFSGLHASKGWESDDEARERYKRIVDGLVKSVKANEVDVIALQEADPDFMSQILQDALGEDWEIVPDKNLGMITCFNNKKYELKKSVSTEEMQICSLTLERKKSKWTNENGEFEEPGHEFIVHNIHGVYDPFSYRVEERLREFLKKDEHNSIIIGDFNSRIAPLDKKPRNIVTAIVPVSLNQLVDMPANIQRSDFPDGAFYHWRDDRGEIIGQLETEILDLNTGEVFVDNRTKEEVQPWPEYYMVLCLDDKYSEKKVVGKATLGEATIYQYETALQKLFGDEGVRARVAENSYNERAIGICLSANLANKYEEIKNKLESEQGFQFRHIHDSQTGDLAPCIFVPVNKIAQFHAAMAPEPEEIKSKTSRLDYYNQLFRMYHKPLRNLVIGAFVGLVVAGIIIAATVAGGGAPAVFGVIGAAIFGLAKSGAIVAGIGFFAVVTVAALSLIAEAVGYALAKRKASRLAKFGPIVLASVERTPDPLNALRVTHAPTVQPGVTLDQQENNMNWKRESGNHPSLTQKGLGFVVSLEPEVKLESPVETTLQTQSETSGMVIRV